MELSCYLLSVIEAVAILTYRPRHYVELSKTDASSL